MPKGTWLTRPVRIAIMCSLILAFFILSPLLILYTAGFRYDFETGRVLQTGVLSVDITPTEASVVLNGITVDKRIPVRLTNRAPGAYTLLLEQEGHHSWERVIEINSRQTTYIRDIQLFAVSLPIQSELVLDQSASSTFLTSGNTPYILTQTHQGDFQDVGVIDTRTETYTPLIRTAGTAVAKSAWSPYAAVATITIETSDGYETYLIDAANNTVSDQVESQDTPTYFWDIDTPDTLIVVEDGLRYALSADQIIVTETASRRVPAPGDTTYVLSAVDGNTRIVNTNGSSTYNVPRLLDNILDVRGNTLIGTEGSTVYLVFMNNGQGEVYETIEDATVFSHNSDLYIWSPWSIFVARQDGKTELLYRTSEQIASVQLFNPSYGDLLVTTRDSLTVFDPRFNQFTTLGTYEEIKTASVDTDAESMFFFGTVGNRTGFFTLPY